MNKFKNNLELTSKLSRIKHRKVLFLTIVGLTPKDKMNLIVLKKLLKEDLLSSPLPLSSNRGDKVVRRELCQIKTLIIAAYLAFRLEE